YPEVLYVAPATPPAGFVVFESEPLSVVLAIGNATDADLVLNTSAMTPQEAFHVTVLKKPQSAGLPWLSFDADAGLDDHNEPVATRWSENVRVPARGSVSWHATLAFANGASLAGVYELQIAPRFSGMTQRLNPVGTIVRYEVRSISGSAEQAEVARRAL